MPNHPLTGDPVSFAALLSLSADLHPLALASTAVALSDGLRRPLEARFGSPAFEWVPMNEVGSVALACPAGAGRHALDPSGYVEVVDSEGQPCGLGERGEVTATGGRNPVLRLLRYRTGDTAKLAFRQCACGSEAPRSVDFEGRQPAVLRAESGGVVNPVDVSRVLHPSRSPNASARTRRSTSRSAHHRSTSQLCVASSTAPKKASSWRSGSWTPSRAPGRAARWCRS